MISADFFILHILNWVWIANQINICLSQIFKISYNSLIILLISAYMIVKETLVQFENLRYNEGISIKYY